MNNSRSTQFCPCVSVQDPSPASRQLFIAYGAWTNRYLQYFYILRHIYLWRATSNTPLNMAITSFHLEVLPHYTYILYNSLFLKSNSLQSFTVLMVVTHFWDIHHSKQTNKQKLGGSDWFQYADRLSSYSTLLHFDTRTAAAAAAGAIWSASLNTTWCINLHKNLVVQTDRKSS